MSVIDKTLDRALNIERIGIVAHEAATLVGDMLRARESRVLREARAAVDSASMTPDQALLAIAQLCEIEALRGGLESRIRQGATASKAAVARLGKISETEFGDA